jgi:hypothetical protein
MKNRFISSAIILQFCLFLLSCEKETDQITNTESVRADYFTVTVTDRTSNSALLQWTTPTGLPEGENVRYKLLIDVVEIANALSGSSYRVEDLSPAACTGQVIAYTGSGATDPAIPLTIHFVIPQYTAVSPYYATTGSVPHQV